MVTGQETPILRDDESVASFTPIVSQFTEIEMVKRERQHASYLAMEDLYEKMRDSGNAFSIQTIVQAENRQIRQVVENKFDIRLDAGHIAVIRTPVFLEDNSDGIPDGRVFTIIVRSGGQPAFNAVIDMDGLQAIRFNSADPAMVEVFGHGYTKEHGMYIYDVNYLKEDEAQGFRRYGLNLVAWMLAAKHLGRFPDY